MTQTPLTHVLLRARRARAARPAIRFKRHRTWIELDWGQYVDRIEAAAFGLAALGVGRGDRVALLSATRFEWATLDLATLSLGAVAVPIYQSHAASEVEAILVHAEPRVIVCEDGVQIAKWEKIARACPSIEAVVVLDPGPDVPEEVLDWDDLLNCGLEMRGRRPDHFASEIAATTLDEVATIVYTSGTTGQPKGVVLTHRQIMSEVEDLMRAFPISAVDRTLSFLPYAHVLGRVEPWLHVYVGFTLAFAESFARLPENLREVRPTVIIGVPRVFEKIHEAVLQRIARDPVAKRVFPIGQTTLGRGLVDQLVYRRVRAGLGGSLRFVVSGGAPLAANVGEFFDRVGILILEGYGLTETTGAIAVNVPGDYAFGTVGRPLADVEIKLAPDGEILVRSAKLFARYHGDPEATAAAFEDGFFRTGDVGAFTPAGHLVITDRKKDMIKTAGGKFVAPQKLERLLKRDPLVSNVLIHGDRRKYVVALITLNETHLVRLATERGWSFADLATLTQQAEVERLVADVVADANRELASFETIKAFAVLPRDFTLERGELTPSLKVKRRVLDETYRDLLNALYEGSSPSRPARADRA